MKMPERPPRPPYPRLRHMPFWAIDGSQQQCRATRGSQDSLLSRSLASQAGEETFDNRAVQGSLSLIDSRL